MTQRFGSITVALAIPLALAIALPVGCAGQKGATEAQLAAARGFSAEGATLYGDPEAFARIPGDATVPGATRFESTIVFPPAPTHTPTATPTGTPSPAASATPTPTVPATPIHP